MSINTPNNNHTVTRNDPDMLKKRATPTSYAVLLKLQGAITQAECDEARRGFVADFTGPSSTAAVNSETPQYQGSKSCVTAKEPVLKPEANHVGDADLLSGLGAWCDDYDSADMPRSDLEQSLVNVRGSGPDVRDSEGKSKPM
ncbi:hypothetical protein LTR56_009972 [Elasticomyces elasticus]|nr:hypothetical protein LTR56_009972 [Elasticomyces elasticus]KAK3656180.1 hypothetical protein LTR22_009887 [Elasticomyces elasticus]KAK4933759.1 hypothetical protein LTR49_000225 [Elasticomyces elasticus]KAK5756525.1 hypothetical protein LTS12_013360 [Elasticomyces elasticus]